MEFYIYDVVDVFAYLFEVLAAIFLERTSGKIGKIFWKSFLEFVCRFGCIYSRLGSHVKILQEFLRSGINFSLSTLPEKDPPV